MWTKSSNSAWKLVGTAMRVQLAYLPSNSLGHHSSSPIVLARALVTFSSTGLVVVVLYGLRIVTPNFPTISSDSPKEAQKTSNVIKEINLQNLESFSIAHCAVILQVNICLEILGLDRSLA